MISVYEEIKPLYTIKRYTDETYSVCKFKRSGYDGVPVIFGDQKVNDSKLDNNFSRARSMIKQYGLCNPWQYFVSLTLAKEKYNRYDLRVFNKDLQQWIRDERKRLKKKYPGCPDRLQVLLVPENHIDGAWHMHGFVNGLPDEETALFERGKHPRKLVDGGFLNWVRYSNKFGFCSLGVVRDQYSAVLYACKYINKDVEALADMKGQHLYFPSRGLETAETAAQVYSSQPSLDSFIEWEGKFCSTGMVTGADWSFPLCYDQESVPDLYEKKVVPLKENKTFDPATIDPSYEQLDFWGGVY